MICEMNHSERPLQLTRERKLEVVDLHMDPKWGSPYWVQLMKERDLTPEGVVDGNLVDVTSEVNSLRQCALQDFVSRKVLAEKQFLITGETSGFTGDPITTAFTEDEFHRAFVEPFLTRAREVAFPIEGNWLWAGPSGPHIIGKAIRAILKAVSGLDPFAVDFDPRWYKKLPDDSMSKQRYFAHVVQQIERILTIQHVDVLFSTPPVIELLATRLDERARMDITGVHYGGMSIEPDQYELFRTAFPNAVHLSGYGNSLCGVFIETGCTESGIEYATDSDRVEVAIVLPNKEGQQQVPVGETGQVMFSRYDESMLLLNMKERDLATRTENGIRHPHPQQQHVNRKVLY